MENYDNYIGKKFNKLTILGYYKENCRLFFVCYCECGNTKSIRADKILSGKTKSCGCLSKLGSKPYRFPEISRKEYYKLQDTWLRIKARCFNKSHHKYISYGGRGISVCKEWIESLDAFVEWSLSNGFALSLSLDRIDNNGNYSPDNCRWATRSQQQRNRNNTLFFSYNNETRPVAEWCEIWGLPYDTTKERIKHGWSVDRIISTPIQKKQRKIKTSSPAV